MRQKGEVIPQDIRRGDTTIIFDPKGDSELIRSCFAAAKAAGRKDDVITLDFPVVLYDSGRTESKDFKCLQH